MSDLKKQLIRLGSTNPELRPHIREILASKNLTVTGLVNDWLEECAVQVQRGLISHPNKYRIDKLKHLARVKVWLGPSRGPSSQEILLLLGLTGDIQKPEMEMSFSFTGDKGTWRTHSFPVLGMYAEQVGSEIAKVLMKWHPHQDTRGM